MYRAIRSLAFDIRGRRAERSVQRPETRPVRAARGSKAPASIVVRDDKGNKVGTHKLDGAVQLGRADACHIRLTDVYASQFHARIYPKDGTWMLEDLGSTNGTYLNRQRVSGTAEVHAGDQIRIGKTTLELRR